MGLVWVVLIIAVVLLVAEVLLVAALLVAVVLVAVVVWSSPGWPWMVLLHETERLEQDPNAELSVPFSGIGSWVAFLAAK